MPADMFKVTVTFKDQSGNALTGKEYTVRLIDEDKYLDDKLGASGLSADGQAEFIFSVADILSIDSPAERTPDLYFVVEKDGESIFRSSTYTDTDFTARHPVTGLTTGLTKSFGPFQVTTG